MRHTRPETVQEDEITGLCLKEKQNSSFWKHLDSTWTRLCSVTPSDRTGSTGTNQNMGNFILTQETLFTMRASDPWKSLPKGAGDVTNLSPGWAALAHLLGDLQQPLPASIFAVTQGCSYMRLFHNFPTFTSPTCPQPCSSIQAQCLLKAVFSRAGTTPNPQFLGLLLRQQQIFKGDERTWFKTAFGCYIFIT